MKSKCFIVGSNRADRCNIYIKSTGELATTIIFHRFSDDYSNEQYLIKLLKVMDSYVKQWEG